MIRLGGECVSAGIGFPIFWGEGKPEPAVRHLAPVACLLDRDAKDIGEKRFRETASVCVPRDGTGDWAGLTLENRDTVFMHNLRNSPEFIDQVDGVSEPVVQRSIGHR